MDPASRGAIVGLLLSTTKADITRAVLDSACYEMKINLNLMERCGIKIEELRAIGGGARSPRWLKIRADVFGKRVVSLEVTEAACLGAAILSGTAVGVYKKIEEGVKATVRVKDRYEPDMEQHEIYADKCNSYSEIYPVLRQLRWGRSRG
jgi:xylulokinase